MPVQNPGQVNRPGSGLVKITPTKAAEGTFLGDEICSFVRGCVICQNISDGSQKVSILYVNF